MESPTNAANVNAVQEKKTLLHSADCINMLIIVLIEVLLINTLICYSDLFISVSKWLGHKAIPVNRDIIAIH